MGLCLLAPFVALLWVGSYARTGPRFIGIPFFYWYQILWVPVSTVLTAIAYVLVRREERRRGAARAAGADSGGRPRPDRGEGDEGGVSR
ncbi:DUF3311 domain-containing protein [Streptomyces sp. B1866]|uniref:DUF3311 domain-containing protein n=1 Tax=Streptomyces sp. B1866 TaxID=3075431 RepID=UPI00288FEC0F|nr:DUF3311 domain-containing protein [Streptomyces sp. B1866]MDT3396349.1 DUF3311 domain-containing protein [Streptomyces sp. B1866]